jgi:hypothetical protein
VRTYSGLFSRLTLVYTTKHQNIQSFDMCSVNRKEVASSIILYYHHDHDHHRHESHHSSVFLKFVTFTTLSVVKMIVRR